MKKENECYFAEQFLRALGEDQKYFIQENEAPDIVLHEKSTGRRVGLEMTRFSYNSNMYSVISTRQNIIKKASLAFFERYKKIPGCTFFFETEINIRKSELDKYAIKVAKWIFEVIEKKKYNQEWILVESDHPSVPLPGLSVTIQLPFSDSDLEWGISGFFSTPADLPFPQIERIVGGKHKKVTTYAETFDEKWLLIYQSAEPGAWYAINPEEMEKLTSSFDRIFLFLPYHYQEKKVLEIPQHPQAGE